MGSLLDVLARENTAEEVARALQEYRNFLISAKARLPTSAYEFATAPWHYNYEDRRCPHDSWVESIMIREPSSGSREEFRDLEIVVRLLGAFHDGYLELVYTGVWSYSLAANKSKAQIAHGDWLADEVSLSTDRSFLHEVLFGSGARWRIESKDIHWTCTPTI